jgi:hypothetical protein
MLAHEAGPSPDRRYCPPVKGTTAAPVRPVDGRCPAAPPCTDIRGIGDIPRRDCFAFALLTILNIAKFYFIILYRFCARHVDPGLLGGVRNDKEGFKSVDRARQAPTAHLSILASATDRMIADLRDRG